MPKYRIKLSDGRTVTVEASAPPSEADVLSALGSQQAAPPAQAGPAPEQRSVSGFLGNVVESGGKFLKDSVGGMVNMLTDTSPRTYEGDRENLLGSFKALGQRYNSPSQAVKTLYTDPVGAAADASSVLGMGSMAAMKYPRAAGFLRTASDATNPMRAVTAPLAAVAREAGIGAVRATVRPPKSVRDDFGGSRNIAKTIVDEGITTEKGAQRRLTGSRQSADALLAERQAAGVAGVPVANVANALGGAPAQTAGLRTRLGLTNQRQPLSDRAQNIRGANAGRTEIPLTEAQVLKREAQDLAYESGKQNLSLDKQANEAIAKALRESIEQQVPEVGPINQRTQRLIGAQRSMFEAEDRPQALTNMLAGGFGIGTGAINPLGGIAAAATVKALNSPRAGTMAGIGVDRAGRALNAKAMIRAAILARLMEQGEQQD